MIRPILAGAAAGFTLAGLTLWAFARGCPVFDIEHDSILGF